MPSRQVAAVATVIACTGVLAALDDVTLTYSPDEIADGRDIDEGIYGSHGSGEFDEWRLRLGWGPGMDRIKLKQEINGAPYPGPSRIEEDHVANDPVVAPTIGLQWVLGDYDSADQGWFSSIAIEYARRDYTIIYTFGAESVPLTLQAVTVYAGMGYGWYLNSRLRYELEPFVGAGMMWAELDLVDLDQGIPAVQASGGPVVEGGLRNALIWHPARTQGWHVGASLDYRMGYAQTNFDDEGAIGTLRSEAQFYWAGLGAMFFVGGKF